MSYLGLLLVSNRIISVKYEYLKPFNCMHLKLFVLDNNNWNYLTVCKQISSDLFKDYVTYKLFTRKSYI